MINFEKRILSGWDEYFLNFYINILLIFNPFCPFIGIRT